jgi:asparagine synthase (glutamine-hydrolysing)
MWAFTLWDTKKNKLILCRDRMGKKPLYYIDTQRNFACASELPALKKLYGNQLNEDLNSTADYFRYGYCLPGTTIYKEALEILPGHIATWSPGEKLQQTQYWQLTPSIYQGSKADAKEELRERLIESVKLRMVADVEVGAFLSGGVDSSLIVGIMCKELGIKPKTFTIGFNDPAFDERTHARQVAESYGTQHYEKCLQNWDKEKLEDLIINHVGQPFLDSSLLPTTMVSEYASEHVKVALSGDGGDELFCGYERYKARTILRWYSRLPRFLQSSIEKLIKLTPEPMVHHSHSLLKKAHLFLDITDRLKAETPYIAPVFYSHKHLQSLLPEIHTKGHQDILLPAETAPDDISRMLYADASVYLPQDILCKADRASMSASLESRAPFLDSKLVELAFSFPLHWHYRFPKGKRMLELCAGDLVSKKIWGRRKQGFGVPIHSWFRGELGTELKNLIEADNDTPINKKAVLTMLNSHVNNVRDFGHRLWGIYVYLLWRKHHLCQ